MGSAASRRTVKVDGLQEELSKKKRKKNKKKSPKELQKEIQKDQLRKEELQIEIQRGELRKEELKIEIQREALKKESERYQQKKIRKRELRKEDVRKKEVRISEVESEVLQKEIRTDRSKYDNVKHKFVMVAALDFGTTFSAYAFSFLSSPNNILMNNNWGAGVGFESFKAPTCVLTKPNGEFQSFGYDAENQYSELESSQTEPETGYNLYRQFKMLLHQKGIHLSSTVTSTSGNVRPAIDIFTMAIQYLKGHMLDTLRLSVNRPPKVSMIQWVLTMPAIWTDKAKRFMREAAYKAGLVQTINSEQLLICLEPEAASIFCRSLDLNSFEGRDISKVTFRMGEKLLVIDAGGGTVDITAHQLKADGTVEEIIPASGGPWGGVKVDEKFKFLLKKILGPGFLNGFMVQCPGDWLKFMLNFEKAKKCADPEPTITDGAIRLGIPWNMGSEYTKYQGISLEEAIQEKFDLGVSFSSGNLVISQKVTAEMFTSVILHTVDHVKKLLENPALKGLNYILLVGGFGECKYLQKAVLDVCSGKVQVLIPMSAQLAVIKGAVMYGHRPQQVSGRRARATYGVDLYLPFESKHDPARAVWTDNGKMCKGCFSVMVKKGELLQASVPFKKTGYRQYKDKTAGHFPIYCTEEENPPMYVDEPGVRHLGSVTLTSPSGPLSEECELQLSFGATEVLVEAWDVSRGDVSRVSLSIDFLQ